MGEILKADPRRQRLVLLLAALVSAVSFRVIFELNRALEHIQKVAMLNAARAAEQTLRLTDLFLAAASWALGLVAVYLLIQGLRIWLAGQHPLPGAKVVVDTPVAHGRSAKRRALGGILLAAVLIAAAVWIPAVGRHWVQQAIVLPDPGIPLPEPEQEPYDPDRFSEPVPGEVLVDPRDPRHPINQRSEPKAEQP